MPRILILGGTAEARQLAGRFAARADLDIILSLAGRTASPAAQGVPIRVGGFGGASGLADYLRRERFDALIDATHPYANIISANAVAAAERAGAPLIVLRRPPWRAMPGDRWTEVDGVSGAVRALGLSPRRVFVALGRNELAPFATAPQHFYLFRSVDPIEPSLDVPHAAYITGRGPFAAADEQALLSEQQIETVIAKNSGGTATYGKIEAARALGLAVIVLRRPAVTAADAVETVEAAIARLDHALASTAAATAARGV